MNATITTSDATTVGQEVHDTLDRLMPWGISLLLHMAVALLAVFFVWAMPVAEEQEPPIVPTVRTITPPGPQLWNTSAARRGEPIAEAPANIQKVNVDPTVPDPFAAIGVTGAINLPAGPKTPPVGTKHRIKGKIFGDGDDDIGGGGGGDGGPKSIVFVIDASGSMVEKFTLVQRDLARAIRALSDEDRFNVVFFQQDAAITVLRPGLLPADAKAKQSAIERAGEGSTLVRPRGSSNPLPALGTALAWRPDQIVLLSDNITGAGRYQIELADLIAEVARLKQRHRAAETRIDTVQFLRPDPHDALRRLAGEHAGRYRFVAERDLQ